MSRPDPLPYQYPPSFNTKSADDARIIARTPSPTPSEARELETGAFDWKKLSSWRFWIRKEWLWYYVALVIILVLTALITLYHKQIVSWLREPTKWLHDLKFGWLVPIGILFVISFPPLFGHEIVAMLCGIVWGMWVGFGIVAAGTFLGEVGNFYAFRYCCRARGEKLEQKNLTYACLAKIVREGGFKIALVARLSAIPGHFTTAVFSTCGMGIFVFSLAAILSMPKQFITVYLGVLLEQSGGNSTTPDSNNSTTPATTPSTAGTDTKSRIITDVVLAITILITFLAMWYIYHMMNKAKPGVIYDRRKARQAKLARAASSSSSPSSSPASASADDIPLTATYPRTFTHQEPQPGTGARYRPDDGELGWDADADAALGGPPMQHAGMGREVAGLGARSGGGLGYGGEGGGAYGGGYGYLRTYQDERGGASTETLGSSADTLVRVSEPSRVGVANADGQGRGQGAGEFGIGQGQGRGYAQGQGQLTGSSYRTAWDGLEGGEGASSLNSHSTQQRFRDPFEASENLR